MGHLDVVFEEENSITRRQMELCLRIQRDFVLVLRLARPRIVIYGGFGLLRAAGVGRKEDPASAENIGSRPAIELRMDFG